MDCWPLCPFSALDADDPKVLATRLEELLLLRLSCESDESNSLCGYVDGLMESGTQLLDSYRAKARVEARISGRPLPPWAIAVTHAAPPPPLASTPRQSLSAGADSGLGSSTGLLPARAQRMPRSQAAPILLSDAAPAPPTPLTGDLPTSSSSAASPPASTSRSRRARTLSE